jgi:EpsI family protein
MQTIGVPVHRDGIHIALPNILLEVARECSGINYLVAVLALAVPLALLRLQQTWRRVVLVVSALTIAALANGLRVALIGTLAYYEVGSPLHGPFHVLHGLFVAGIGYVVLFVGLRVLQEPAVAAGGPPVASSTASATSRWRVGEAFGLAALLWALVIVGVTPTVRAVALAQPLDTFPERLGDWIRDDVGTSSDPSADAVRRFWSGATRTLTRRYRSADGRAASVNIWYFEVQQQGREIISHEVDELHRQSTPVSVQLRDGTALHANRVRWDATGEAGLFWYDLGNAPESNQYATKIRSLWNILRSGRNNGAAIMLRVADAAGDPAAATSLDNLAAEIQPAVNQLWSSAGSAGASEPR